MLYALSTTISVLFWLSVRTKQKPEFAIIRLMFHSSLMNVDEPHSPSDLEFLRSARKTRFLNWKLKFFFSWKIWCKPWSCWCLDRKHKLVVIWSVNRDWSCSLSLRSSNHLMSTRYFLRLPDELATKHEYKELKIKIKVTTWNAKISITG
jgi:hypothetical protein